MTGMKYTDVLAASAFKPDKNWTMTTLTQAAPDGLPSSA